ncbi:hypothetical protein O1Q96_00950 (plasmid) [Streptomyces sp. Qhu-G9]|uniref:hypothetical protein n=1 Tax=Streptomyces sp. Qhu-G9 TaxID=3452799 RepID=UPI0022ABE65E|nr:hypothetical protein [Streptomyces aurantiacus]WAU78440.1 hypothetical protein O1Q96_00950 [Streptomyces aurantiacus]
MPLPDHELDFESTPGFEESWLKENQLLEFRCEFRPTGQRVRARLRTRLAVAWRDALRIPRLGEVLPPKFKLITVENLDFVVALDGKRVFDVVEARPEQDGHSLVVPVRFGGSLRISNIVYNMNKSVERMTDLRSGQAHG